MVSRSKIIFFSVLVYAASIAGCGGSNGGGSNSVPDTTIVPDTTPDPFSFSTVNDADLADEYTSSVTMTGFDSPASISISSGEYSINGAPFRSTTSTVLNNQIIEVRLTSSDQFETSETVTVTVGGIDGSFTVTTAAEDLVPDAFTFANLEDTEPESLVFSNAITVAGTNNQTSISIVGGEYSIDNGPYVSSEGLVSSDQSVQVRLVTPSSFVVGSNATLTIGGISDEFNAQNRAAVPTVTTTFPVKGYFTDSSIDVAGIVRYFSGNFSSIQVTVTSGSSSFQTNVNASHSWRIEDVPLFPVNHSAEILISATNGSETAHQTISLDMEPRLIEPGQIVADQTGNKIYLGSVFLGAIVEFDQQTGRREILTGPQRGGGPALGGIEDMVLEGDRLLVANGNYQAEPGLISVDLSTGNRSWVSGGSVGAGPEIERTGHIALDPLNNRVFLVSRSLLANPARWSVYSIDLNSGDRSLVFDDSIGSNEIETFSAIEFSETNNEILIGDRSAEKIFAYSLSSGELRTVVDAEDWPNLVYGWPVDLSINPDNGRLFVSAQQTPVVEVDLASGDVVEVDGVFARAGIDYSQATGSLYFPSGNVGSLLQYDLETRELSELFNSRVGESTGVDDVSGISFSHKPDEIFLNTSIESVSPSGRSRSRDIRKIRLNSGEVSVIGNSLNRGRLVFNPNNRHLLVTNYQGNGTLFDFDPITGRMTDLYPPQFEGLGGGTPFCIFRNSQTAFILSGGGVFQLDITTSTGDIFFLNDTAYGDVLGNVSAIGCDETNNRLMLLNFDPDGNHMNALYEVDVDSKVRSLVYEFVNSFSDPNPDDIVYSQDRRSLFISAQGYSRGIWGLDGNGDISEISVIGVGRGPRMEFIPTIAIDEEYSRFLVTTGDRVYLVDRVSGDRQLIFW